MNTKRRTLWNSANALRNRLRHLASQKTGQRTTQTTTQGGAAAWIDAFLERLALSDLVRLFHDWPVWAGGNQTPPGSGWRTWLLLGGRGAGKTRAGAEWSRAIASGDNHFAGSSGGRLALIGQTYSDARAVMVEGESGILAVHEKRNRPVWNPSLRQLTFANGAIAQLYSAADPESLRGAQFGAAWTDELAKWRHLQECWDMLQFCMRLGGDPRIVATTTPKPLAFFRRLIGEETTAVTRTATDDNAHNLAAGFLAFLRGEYGGTRLGRQELDGEIVEDNDNALWRRSDIEGLRCEPPKTLKRILVAVDPPATSGRHSDACGIVATGLGEDGICYVLADRTLQQAKPSDWANAAIALYHALGADAVVAETNQGGEMVRSVVNLTDASVAVREVRAARAKWLRAEPVALLYERGLVRHAGRFPQLEDEMCAFGHDGLSNGHSPDRVDALVWAVSELMLGRAGRPQIRSA